MQPKVLQTRIPRSETTLKVYENEIVFSEAAVVLLGMTDDEPRVSFMYDGDALAAGRKRIYVAGGEHSWPIRYVASRRDRRRVVRSRPLAEILAENLDGYGTYRICPEDCYNDGKVVWYNLFFKKYDR